VQVPDVDVRLERVTKDFGETMAVDDLSLDIAEGEFFSMLGPSGCGKTTTLRMIGGFEEPTRGTIYLGGRDVTDLPPWERIRRGMRRTYQSSLLFPSLAVIDNLYLAVRGVGRGRLSLLRTPADDPTREAADRLAHAVHLDQVAGQPVSELSHGQQRQLEIGMALAGAPRLILFDEPAAGLSPAERRELVALLTSLPAHMSYVLIEHDLDIALKVTERVTVMHNGRVLKTGTPSEIENDAQVQAIYMGGKH